MRKREAVVGKRVENMVKIRGSIEKQVSLQRNKKVVLLHRYPCLMKRVSYVLSRVSIHSFPLFFFALPNGSPR